LPTVIALLALAGIAVGCWVHYLYRRHTRELRDNEERFRGLFDHALEGVFESDARGGFRRVNPALAQILGYTTPDEVLLIPPEQIERIYSSPQRREEFYALLGTQEQVLNFESEIIRPDGTRAWIKENVRAIRDGNGQLRHLQGFVSDITARKHDEEALRLSEERYRTMFEHSPIGMLEFDNRVTMSWQTELRAAGVTDFSAWCDAYPDQLEAAIFRVRVVGANRTILRLLGAAHLESLEANFAHMLTPEAAAARRQVFDTLWTGRAEHDGEMTLRALDGTLLPFYYHWWVPSIGGQPQFSRTQLALVDLTGIRSTETALAAERERLSVTLRAMTEGVVTTDPVGRIQFMNDAGAALTGWSITAAIGRPLQEVWIFGSGQVGEPVVAPVAAALAADAAIDLPPQAVLQPREGRGRRVDGRCAPMHDTAGQIIGTVLVVRDITDRAQLESELLRASKLESVGVLAGGIAHDFNNLLTIVTGNLTLALLDPPTAATGGRWLRDAERGALRAKELTQQLLTFAKGGEPVRSAVPLGEVVREAAEFALHGASVRCDFEIAPDLRPADVDKGQIGQVVQNLVINAVQAMPAGGVIRVSLHNEVLTTGAIGALAAGDYLRLEIADTGSGIDTAHLSHIFEPFFTTKEHGSGLGLATVYSVIRKHRGHVMVESEIGVGTRFRVWLPAARVEPPRPVVTADPFAPLRGRVLFMDDEEPIRIMTKALLERLGLESTVVTDGGEAVREFALARLDGRNFDVIIMDLTVPGAMGGAAAMREILKIDPHARGIVSSGYSSDPVMANYRAHGFRGMVPKPYRISDFARTLREVLNGD
jgi:PAS domain S-box-containing protein